MTTQQLSFDLGNSEPSSLGTEIVPLAPGATLLRNFAKAQETPLLESLDVLLTESPPTHMQTPGGATMSVAMTNCGSFGWVSSRNGYRYSAVQPETGAPWPQMPSAFIEIARASATEAGFPEFLPDACLVNVYTPGTRLSLHQDKDEADMAAPIVSISLGLPAVFLFGGFTREAKTQRISLFHGDVVVWGGPARLRYHGVLPIQRGHHALVGSQRINLTFRQAH